MIALSSESEMLQIDVTGVFVLLQPNTYSFRRNVRPGTKEKRKPGSSFVRSLIQCFPVRKGERNKVGGVRGEPKRSIICGFEVVDPVSETEEQFPRLLLSAENIAWERPGSEQGGVGLFAN